MRVCSHISNSLGYIIGGSVTTALSPVALLVTGITTLFQSLAWGVRAIQRSCTRDLTKRAIYDLKCQEWENQVIKVNRQYVKTFALCLIPIAGFYHVWNSKIINEFKGNLLVDCLIGCFGKGKIKKVAFNNLLYPLAGHSLVNLSRYKARLKHPYWGNIHRAFAALDTRQKLTHDFMSNIRKIVWGRGRNFNLECVKISVSLSAHPRQIDAVYVPGITKGNVECDKTAPTVILFHGNGDVLDSQQTFIEFYRSRGINSLAITMGDYPGSDPVIGGICEESTYQDAQAAVDFVLTRGVPLNRILVHGVSIGGTLASYAALRNPGIRIVLDQTFTKISGPADIMIRQMFKIERSRCLDKWVINFIYTSRKTLISRMVKVLFPTDHSKGLDAYNNLRKLKLMNTDIIVIMSSKDEIVGDLPKKLLEAQFKNKNEQFENQLDAKAANDNLSLAKSDCLIRLKGRHAIEFTSFDFARRQMEIWLFSTGLMDPANIIDLNSTKAQSNQAESAYKEEDETDSENDDGQVEVAGSPH